MSWEMSVLMLIIGIGCLIMMVLCEFRCNKYRRKNETKEDIYGAIGYGCMIFGGLLLLITPVLAIYCGWQLLSLRTINEKITIYEQENYEVYKELTELINMTMGIETSEINESVNELTRYYKNNNKTIIELKLKKANGYKYRWWLYFDIGG